MTDPNHQKILDKVDASRDQAIEFLQKMIAIPSVTGDEAAIQKFVSRSHERDRSRGRYVGDRLGSAQEAPGLSTGRARL